jgi:arylsulfatase A-like enzyme
MNRRQFLPLLPAAAAAAGQTPARKPNFVFLLSDDMGYGDLSCYGSRDIRTPHIDSLARDGVRFTDCYANAPVCTPTRTGFLTGRYQQRFGPDLEWALGPANNKTAGLRPADSVMASGLKAAGYRTGIFGKWHLGWKPEFRPLRHGFDEFFGILLGNADMYSHRYHDGSEDLWENDQPVKQSGYLTDLLADRAASFIEKNSQQQPFFLYLPFNAVHWPFQPPGNPNDIRSLENRWKDGTRKEYVAMTESMDKAVGHVLDALRRKGMDENTFVVFTNDNGGERLSNSGPLFHTKGTVFEGGIRVPALARFPGRIPARSTTAQAAITMDFTRTFLEAAGAAGNRPLDGVDLLPVLSGRQRPIERSLFWRIDQSGRRQFAVRRGRWKLIDDNSGNRNLPELLFDVVADPGERANRYYENQDLAAKLRAEYMEWQKQVQPTA